MRESSDTDLLPLDDAAMASVRALFDSLGREGFRVLGIAWRQVETDYPHAVVSDETKLVFSGFAAFLDPPKESAKKALTDLAASGVSVKIVTGDNELVTEHICGQLGLSITGNSDGSSDIRTWTIKPWWDRWKGLTCFVVLLRPRKIGSFLP